VRPKRTFPVYVRAERDVGRWIATNNQTNDESNGSKYGRTIAARLKDDEMASLNQLMAQNSIPNLTALLRGLVRGPSNAGTVNNAFGAVNNLILGG